MNLESTQELLEPITLTGLNYLNPAIIDLMIKKKMLEYSPDLRESEFFTMLY